MNQLRDFALDLKHTVETLKLLLSGKNAYVWKAELKKALDEIKEILCVSKALKRFDLAKLTVLLTYVSRKGLDYVLI